MNADLAQVVVPVHCHKGSWLATMPGYWARSYDLSSGDMGRMLSGRGALEAEGIRSMMLNGYRLQPKEQAGSYRELFSRLLSNKGPLIVNCTAGKDRTGVASALVLTALGVPYETVREDYLLSNGAPGMAMLASSLPGPFASLPPETMRLLAGVDASYLDAAFDQIRKDYGSVDGYLKNELGMGPKQIKLLRGIMLAPVRLLTVWA